MRQAYNVFSYPPIAETPPVGHATTGVQTCVGINNAVGAAYFDHG